MKDQERLQQLIQEYEDIRLKFIEAVGGSLEKNELDSLKRRLETIVSQIRKIDVNHKL
jgi:hypothetical protein